MNYQELFNESDLSYTDVAYELGCCELTARNKISGKSKITKAEAAILDQLFNRGDDNKCTISRHNR
jgi:plasmid maintenance system antidote protein VapI